jgi:hypothetical protein
MKLLLSIIIVVLVSSCSTPYVTSRAGNCSIWSPRKFENDRKMKRIERWERGGRHMTGVH